MEAVNLNPWILGEFSALKSGFCRFPGFGIVLPAKLAGSSMKNLLLVLLLLPYAALTQGDVPAHPYIKFETTEGDIIVELDGRRAPITVANFLALVDDGYFDGLIFHRVIPNFMIQAGGYTPGLILKESEEGMIFNESGNGLRNVRGTIAMARREEPHTAKAQFYINLNDNKSLNPQPDRWGYAVFGFVIEGMDVIDNIADLPTGPQGSFSKDVPTIPVVIKKASRHGFE
jgi:cyclophilin family peptidyl-prolyl cis-trans isomerase